MDQARYAELFRTEAGEHLDALDMTLLDFETAPHDGHVATLFRSMHTVKGMAAAMGYRVVERIAHDLESLLDRVRGGEAVAHHELVTRLFAGTATLRSAVEAAMRARDEPASPLTMGARSPVDGTRLEIAEIDPLTGLTRPSEVEHEPSPSARLSTATEACLVHVRLAADCPLKGVRAMLVLARLESMGSVRSADPPQSRWYDEPFDGVFELTLLTAAPADVIEASVRAAGEVARVRVSTVSSTSATRVGDPALTTVRVERKRLDSLLDLVGELVVTRDRLLRVAEESDTSSTRVLTRVAQDTARLISAVQDEVLQARLVPIGQVFERFPRVVRDIAQDLGKEVRFVMEGREIELDRSLLDAIGDPLMHLLRNALDHGIEDPETRRAAGKSPTGTLTIRAVRDRAAIVLQVEDDGRGIDRQAILGRAHQHGLVSPGITQITDEDLLQVLAHPGLSTARAVTAISGRGVGVDVVATRVRSLGGTLALETLEGEGSVFSLRVPVTLAIMRALLVVVEGSTFALPAAHVIEALEFDDRMLVPTTDYESITLRDEVLPLLHVRERFHRPRREAGSHVVVVEVAGRRTALVVDAVMAQLDIVVKPYQAVKGSAQWFSGATVLGDGTPALIVDLGSLT